VRLPLGTAASQGVLKMLQTLMNIDWTAFKTGFVDSNQQTLQGWVCNLEQQSCECDRTPLSVQALCRRQNITPFLAFEFFGLEFSHNQPNAIGNTDKHFNHFAIPSRQARHWQRVCWLFRQKAASLRLAKIVHASP
jgi:hypothetical protein